jgi:hypothetical protein
MKIVSVNNNEAILITCVDCRYFARSNYIGFAAFRNLPLFDQSINRGARMASVGIIVAETPKSGPYGQPWRHLDFLKKEVG